MVGATRCRNDEGMRNEAQTDSAEISRHFWNDNEPLSLPPGELRRVSMMKKRCFILLFYFFVGLGSVCMCGFESFCVSVFLPKHHLGAITDMKKVFTAVSLLSHWVPLV